MIDRSPIIVARHAGLVEWLARRGVMWPVIPHATAADVADRVVYGTLPLALAARAHVVYVPHFRAALPADRRGDELSADEMDLYRVEIVSYVVKCRGFMMFADDRESATA